MIKNDALMNILTGQQGAFDANVSGLAGGENLLASNPEMAAEFMAAFKDQLTSPEQLALGGKNLAQNLGQTSELAGMLSEEMMAEMSPQELATHILGKTAQASQSQMPLKLSAGEATQLAKLDVSGLELTAQQKLDLAQAQKIAQKLEMQQTIEKPMAELAGQGEVANASKAKLAGGKLQSSEDFVNQMQMGQNLKPKIKSSKNLKAKIYDQNAPQKGMFNISQKMESTQSMMLNSKNGAIVQTNHSAQNMMKNNLGEITSDSNMSAEMSGENLADILSQSNGLNNTMKSNSTTSGIEGSDKVFNMSQISESDTTNMDQMISKISDYIIQSRASSEPRVEMAINHAELGQIDLVVEKASQDIVNISIAPKSLEGSQFFNSNKAELLSVLSNSGVQVGEFKLDSSAGSSFGNNSGDQSSNNQFAGNSNNNQFGSQRGQQDSESQRRKELWDLLSNKEAA